MGKLHTHFNCTAQYKRQIAPYTGARHNEPTLIEHEARKFAKSAAGAPVFYKRGIPVLDPRINIAKVTR